MQPISQPSVRNLGGAVGKGTLFGILSSIVQIGTRLISVPIVIRFLGLEGYGIWAIVMSLAAYMRFGAAGTKSAFQKYVAEATGSGDYARASRLLSTGSLVTLLISAAAVLPLAIWAPQLARAAGVPAHFLEPTIRCIAVLSLVMVLTNAGSCYQAVVMGAHRIDLARAIDIPLAVLEAVGVVAALYLGYGLVAMACIMAISEVANLVCCYLAARKVAPAIEILPRHFSRTALREFCSFAGTYQLVSILEILSAALIPIAILKFYGATAAGIFAVAGRVVWAASFPQTALLLAMLSGSSAMYSGGSREDIGLFLAKSFKTAMVVAVFPFAFVACFGAKFVLAWTGQSDPAYDATIQLMCLAGFFKSLSSFGRVLYRSSGKYLLDSIQLLVLLLCLACYVTMASALGFQGLLTGLAVAEFVGMLIMGLAVARTFPEARGTLLMLDAIRISLALLGALGVGVLISGLRLPSGLGSRSMATAALALGGIGCGIATWPALRLAGAVSQSESRALLEAFRSRSGPVGHSGNVRRSHGAD